MNIGSFSLTEPPRERLWLSERVQLNYYEIGGRTNPVLLMLHGAAPGASALSNYRNNFAALAAAGFRVVLPDLLGFGDSSKPTDRPYDLAMLAEPISDLLDVLQIHSCNVLGSSFGGAIANYIALRQPERLQRMVLVAPHCLEPLETYASMPGVKAMREALNRPAPTLADVRAAFRLMVYDPGHLDDRTIAERAAGMLNQPQAVMGSLAPSDITAELSAITQRMLVFWGANDQLAPASGGLKIVERCPNADLIIWNRTGHWAHVERAEQFNALAIQFLSGRD